MDEVWCVRPFVKVWSWAISFVRVGGILEQKMLEIYPLQKGGLRTSFPRWGVAVLWKERCMHVGPIVGPICTKAYIK